MKTQRPSPGVSPRILVRPLLRCKIATNIITECNTSTGPARNLLLMAYQIECAESFACTTHH
jgi:hypothetical protein